MKKIREAQAQEWEGSAETTLKKRLIALLQDDGKGHRHAKFAARLKDFLIKIIDRNEQPNFTAAIQWEEPETIFVSSGFLTNDEKLFGQLSVLMRHELAHNLMCHEIRMMHKITKKYGKKHYTRLKMSQSIHQILNIIEDFEISNERYTPEDKITVEHLWCGGREIKGLVTEKHRDWDKMSLEEMYDAINEEIATVQNRILQRFDQLDLADKDLGGSRDFITREIVSNLNNYTDYNHPTNFFGTLDKYMQDKALYHFVPYDDNGRICMIKYSNLPEQYQEIIKAIAKEFTEANGYNKQDLRDIVKEIAKTSGVTVYNINDKKNHIVIDLYTPEEKFLAIDCLKAIIPTLEEYNTWYEKIQKTLSDPKYANDLQRIFDEVNK